MRADQKKFMEDMNKRFGKNAIRLASAIVEERALRISTGSLALDIALGGGIPLGRFIQISGAFSSMKSTLCYHIIRNFQNSLKDLYEMKLVKKKNPKDPNSRDIYEYKPTGDEVPMTAALIQAESESWTNEYGRQIGIDIDALMFNPTAGMEEALEIAHLMQEQIIADLIVIDSLEALTPMKEYEKTMADNMQMGIKPKLFGEYFRKYQASNNKLSREELLPVTVIGINQLREKIGAYGDPEYTPGGRAKDFAASIDLRLKRKDWITIGSGENKQVIGQVTAFKVHKNKTGVPQRTGSFDFYFDEGGPVLAGHIDIFKEAVIEGIAYGVVTKAGAWFTYGDIRAQGAENFVEALRSDEEADAIYTQLYNEVLNIALTTDHDPIDRFGDDDDSEENFDE